MTRLEEIAASPKAATMDDVLYLLSIIEKQREALQEILDCDGDNIVYAVHGAAERGLRASE